MGEVDFSKLLNFAFIDLKFSPDKHFPLLIQAGEGSFEPYKPDDLFITIPVLKDGKRVELPYVPGSSLRGAIREYCERLLISIGREKEVGKLFGTTEFASKLWVLDGFPENDGIRDLLRVRAGVAIDRKLQGSLRRRLFEKEVLSFHEEKTIFSSRLILRNFSPRELSIIIKTLLDMHFGGIPRLGHSKSRGMGKLNILHLEATAYFLDGKAPQGISKYFVEAPEKDILRYKAFRLAFANDKDTLKRVFAFSRLWREE